MPTRKAAATENAATEPPRRSSRIASLPQQPAEAAAPKPQRKGSSSNKKRAAEPEKEEDTAETTKKAKPDGEGSGGEDSATASAVVGPIEVGDGLPTLTLKNEKGEDIQIADLANEKGVILFLVPKADTPGCTNQACGFRDVYPDFSSYNFDVYGVSADSSSAQAKWQTKKELPYTLISDPKRALISALGANDGGKTKRSHFIFTKGGKLVEKQIPVKPVESPQLALDFVKTLQSN